MTSGFGKPRPELSGVMEVTGRHAADDRCQQSGRRSVLQGLAASSGGTTPTNEALLEALTYDADAIILITDGAPSDGAKRRRRRRRQ